MIINDAIKKLALREELTEDEVRGVINQIMKGEATSSQIGGFLVGLRVNGETPRQILGAVKAIRDNGVKVEIENTEHLIDTCGTGGDGSKTFNISTAVAIVAASGGAKVAKHGNRAVSSKSGCADVLVELGINIDFDEIQSKKIIEENGMAFLFAPKYNGAMKNVSKERKELGIRTIFNLLGPLANPAPITGQLMGVYDGALLEDIGEVLLNLGLKRAMIVHGDDGLDEITITTSTSICEVKDGKIKNYKLDPEKLGFKKATLDDIKGGEAKENAEIIIKILKGERGPKRDIVVLNSGAALYVANLVDSIEDGIKKASELIDSRAAYKKYEELSSLQVIV
ncbi:anthranilate phosphoribosyltransferase [Clostridium beijerinckii]|uniref:Anthranilate phosphoribosyltransferase n=1 Tax=Clostridium beijerinckii TaxID=1520 RepID=A0AAE5H6J5_CLOBE|nr:anthranilate phosphoribosyltransferase [Clostridium beijerinckii]NRZ26211.1 anthranilate phosphoribosyltransferase [Clostridium beijerinckii]NSB15733.1 anthranilate phosphoribosyltransferase [Clostridium beijerinckii]NYB98725.1 anthranilate phosphoribosyltransferase [Clostridium beijerinckii]OOM21307.1 anthranilate phosphoribosyltransferase [Clostridium beijerinckii]OOM27059.1 anthranilate phosphoribosyltransferase [Clostridium beijerinckii]